jgi:CRP-like cAMP-binding protein
MAKQPIDPVLRELAPFTECSRPELRLASRLVRSISVSPGEVLMRQGDAGRDVMFVAEGAATVTRDGHAVAVVGRGDVVGELSLLVGAPRTATVVARSAMTLAVFDDRDFEAMLDASPAVAGAVLRTAVRRLAA